MYVVQINHIPNTIFSKLPIIIITNNNIHMPNIFIIDNIFETCFMS